MVKIDTELYLVFVVVLVSVFFLPYYGVDKDTSMTINGSSYQVELQDGATLESGDYLGSHDILSNEIKIATGQQGFLSFMNTCSHEVRHLKFDLEDVNREDPRTSQEEHELMNGWGSNYLPWNWQIQCFYLLPDRVGL